MMIKLCNLIYWTQTNTGHKQNSETIFLQRLVHICYLWYNMSVYTHMNNIHINIEPLNCEMHTSAYTCIWIYVHIPCVYVYVWSYCHMWFWKQCSIVFWESHCGQMPVLKDQRCKSLGIQLKWRSVKTIYTATLSHEIVTCILVHIHEYR